MIDCSKDVVRTWSVGLRPILLLLVCITFCCSACAVAQQVETVDVDFFEKRIRPVLVEYCYECHGPDAKRIEGNLRLDSLKGMLRGGDSGPAISVDAKNESLLLSALDYDAFEMPPDGKLPDRVIGDFRNWLAAGAPTPESFHKVKDAEHGNGAAAKTEIDWNRARGHWAFCSIKVIDPPAVGSDAWSSNPIDAFIYDQLRKNGQQPVAEADKHTLVRRLYLNLIGLPPTIDEVEEFVNDSSSDAYPQLIERLLASPHYGERWGRHWLDVVRYADSNGADENHPYPYAWRYRNYVIDALNRDTPFDDFD